MWASSAGENITILGKSLFFFEKKKQKTFAHSGARAPTDKSFCFFFQKEVLSSFRTR
jgi:hypothetical protein